MAIHTVLITIAQRVTGYAGAESLEYVEKGFAALRSCYFLKQHDCDRAAPFGTPRSQS